MKWNHYNQRIVVSLAVLATALAGLHAQADPKVTVTNPATNPVPVSIVNSLSSTNAPVLVRDVDKSARTPFAQDRAVTLTNGQAFSEADLLTPPSGKQAVIETVTVFAELPPGQTPVAIIRAGGLQYFLLLTRQGSLGGKDLYICTFPIRLYHENGPARVSLGRDPDSGDANGTFSVAGYFEDAP